MTIYLRPEVVLSNGSVHPDTFEIAGVTWSHFQSVELIERVDDVISTRQLTGTEAAKDFPSEMKSLTAKRAAICGLSFERPLLMGILNVTPDSFSDGGKFNNQDLAIEHSLQMLKEGADIIDVGGESTRPGADFVSVEEELERVIPVIEAIRRECDAIISVDTRKAEVMQAAIAAGADMINDVSALTFDENALQVASRAAVPVVMMHALGVPQTMQEKPRYNHVVLDIYDYLKSRIEAACAAGVRRENIIIDPGIGFGKTLDHNLALINQISLFHGLGVPVMLGCSRKRFIEAITGEEIAAERLGGSLAGVMKGLVQGVQIFRVHDVKQTRQMLDVWCS